MDDALAEYSQKCKGYIDDYENYSLYVHGYLIPWLSEQRQQGALKTVSGLKVGSYSEYTYTGEVLDGIPTGEGEAVAIGDQISVNMKGTWLNGLIHGYYKSIALIFDH